MPPTSRMWTEFAVRRARFSNLRTLECVSDLHFIPCLCCWPRARSPPAASVGKILLHRFPSSDCALLLWLLFLSLWFLFACDAFAFFLSHFSGFNLREHLWRACHCLSRTYFYFLLSFPRKKKRNQHQRHHRRTVRISSIIKFVE